MTPERWAEIEEIFHSAAEKPQEQRSAYLDERCAGDEELRREVESLLEQSEEPANPIAVAVSDAVQHLPEREPNFAEGQRIGPYRLVGKIGEGGMGTVYRAVRDDDEYRIEVALKVVKRGMDTDHVIHRFRQERQILAGLEHPNIGRLLEGGTTNDGLPYFVMEYVAGENILQYCNHNRLSVESRLNVFRDVCLAVQHAHQRLIIHRDIKPANLLVTEEGIPKLLDFGIAKLLNPDPSYEMPTATMTVLRMMTPDYASPEQVRGLPISTATDVYSLGAVLYELLTGQRPHQIQNYTPTEIERAICQQPTEKPSAAAARSAEASPRLSRLLEGDLDNIVLMAMRKEPERRYQSAGQLAEDINRYLRKFPIIARPDTVVYRAGKFVRRHKLALLTVVLVIFSLLGGIIAALYQAHRAERRFQQVRKLANTFLFEFHDKIRDLPGSTEAREMIVKTALEYLDSLSSEAQGDPSLQWELAEAYQKVADVQGDPRGPNLGHPEEAIRSYQKALSLMQRLLENNPQNLIFLRSLAACYFKVGDLQVEMGNIQGGMQTIQEGIEPAEVIHYMKTGNRDDLLLYIRLHRALGDALLKSRKPTETLDIEEKALKLSDQLVNEFPGDFSLYQWALTMTRVAEAQIELGDLAGGIKNLEKLLEIRTGLVQRNPTDPNYRREWRLVHVWLGNYNGGLYTFSLGDRATAEKYYRKALSIAEELASEDEKNAHYQYDLSICLAKMGEILSESNPSEALVFFEKADAINRDLMTKSPEEFRFLSRKALYRRWISLPLRKTGDLVGAIKNLEESVETLKVMIQQSPTNDEALSGMHDSLLALAESELESGDFSRALPNYQEALKIAQSETAAGPSDLYAKWRLADSYSGLGNYYRKLAEHPNTSITESNEKWREARDWYAKSFDIWKNWKQFAASSKFDTSRVGQAQLALSDCDEKLKR